VNAYWQTLVASAYDQTPPPDRDTAAVAARELASRGLTPRDISAALRLSESAVLALLEPTP
jgi:hypothetical protein